MFFHNRRDPSKALLAGIASLAFVLAGCGGGSSGAASGGTTTTTGGGPTPQAPSIASATLHVDVDSGHVVVLPGSVSGGTIPAAGDHIAQVVLGGTAISFNSSLLSDQPGDVGVKVLNVSMTNHFGLPIGQDPAGTASDVRVLFSAFTNGFSDLRPRTQVATFAGTGAAGSLDGSVGAATFSGPYGTAVDASGTVYVADFTSNKIRKITAGFVTTLAGSGVATSVDGFGAAATFHSPSSVALNPVDGAIIVCDYLGNRIRRITPAGAVSTIAGTGAAGTANGTGAVATFNGPIAAVVDSTGNMYLSDRNGFKIRKITFAGGDPTLPDNYIVTTLAGSGVSASTDGVGIAAAFSGPFGLTLGNNSDLYVCDAVGRRIRRVGFDGVVTTIAGKSVSSSVDGTGDVATFLNPTGIAYANGGLFISDPSANLLRQMTLSPGGSLTQASSWNVRTLAGTGGAGGADGAGDVATFNGPRFISADLAGNLYVPDYTNNKIRRVMPANGNFPIGVPGGALPATPVMLSNANGLIAQSAFGANQPYLVYPGPVAAGASTGTKPWWFVVPSGVGSFEFQVVVEALTGGLEPPGPSNSVVRTLAGVTNSNGFLDGTGAEARMGLIKYSDLDAAGNLYFTDLTNNAIRFMSPQGLVHTIAGGPGNVATAADGTGATAKIASINAIAVSADGSMVFFGDGNLVRIATIPYYADRSDAGNWTITTLGGTVSAGNTNGVLTGASFNTIEDMAWDANSKVLYLTEFFGNRIRKLLYKGGGYTSGANWQVSTLAGDDTAISGASGNVDATGTNARIFNPRGIDVDAAGNVYFADQSNFTIRKITPLQVVTTIAGSGVQGYQDGSAFTAKFSLPYGLCVDSAGYIYIGDIGTFTVRRIDPQGTVSTVAGIPSTPSGIDGPGATATFVRPAGLSVNGSGDLFVCDQSSLRLIQRSINTGSN